MIVKIYRWLEPKFPPIRIIRDYYRRLFVIRRYKHMYQTIRRVQSENIMEIGTFDGENARRMINESGYYSFNRGIHYYGFDLFEALDDKTELEEFALVPPSMEIVQRQLEKTKADVHLYKGFTQDTLPKVIGQLPYMNVVFIDGGHSIKTIENDWKYVQGVMDVRTIVFFDDYWNQSGVGCNQIVDNIDRTKYDVEILPTQDKFNREWGKLIIKLAQVKKRV